ncbi:cell wall metabolism sensor histidine kinase WalK [Metabacillus sp. GX 13764]|uniref:cell wall metabolism sensor histidine kinase WalK n=1 Tax=Metabacillus kandeliae TaxID=2900151 RepID=UPI001E3B6C02|nr:cell wall metabolism sensor histidine kinase WalK [Metabacillus kandeliae]MCD7035313.1 cell wall metabolism sensor histidine kinase WalK [Metabacillus kandeliae]
MGKVSFFRSIHFKFTMIYVLLIIIAMQIIGVYFVRQLETSLSQNFKSSLVQRITLLSSNVQQELDKDTANKKLDSEQTREDLTSILLDFKSDEIRQVQIIDSNYRVLATSEPNDQVDVGKKTANKPTVRNALEFNTADEEIKVDPATNNRLMVSATPIVLRKGTTGAIYVEASMKAVFDQMKVINNILATGTVISLFITAILGIILARTITRPLSDMRKHAMELAKGNFKRKVRVYGHDEIGQLASTFNHLTEELDEAHAQTEGERKKLDSVITNMTDGVLATNRLGEIILINEIALQMLNVSRGTAIHTPITKLLEIEEEVTFDQLIENPDSMILDVSSEDKPYILRVNFSIIQQESRIDGLIAVIYDITEQEKIDQERREFVANVSHELRTPLTTMRSYLEALAEGAWEDKEIAPHFLQVTQNETERMIRLVNDLLNLSKLDSKDYRLSKDWVNFTDFFNKIIDRFEMTKSQHVSFRRLLPDKELFVDIDTDKITQVLDNIISNAMKYSPEGGLITFRVIEEEEEIVISIKDEGVGIPKDSLKKIFERFYRVDKARTRRLGGTGLGLAIAKEVVNAHDGEIWAESKEGKGTVVSFTLPFSPDQEDEWDEA